MTKAHHAAAKRQAHEEETLDFATGQCTLGRVLVAATDRGIRAVLLGDDAAALRAELAARYPDMRLREAGNALADRLHAVIQQIDGPARSDGPDLPLDMRGTDFQRRVWNALKDIPGGETASYTEIARRIGKPRSVRAVAQACGANALAVLVPCHRVVRSDGALSGYRWGVERKRALLDREQA